MVYDGGSIFPLVGHQWVTMGPQISLPHFFGNIHGIQHIAINVATASVRFVLFSSFPSSGCLNRNGCDCRYFWNKREKKLCMTLHVRTTIVLYLGPLASVIWARASWRWIFVLLFFRGNLDRLIICSFDQKHQDACLGIAHIWSKPRAGTLNQASSKSVCFEELN